MRQLTAMFAILLATGCAQTTMFRAAEKATAISPRGAVAAEYDLMVRGRDVGEVKVWSNGAYHEEAYGKEHGVIHVGFEIENHANVPVTLDRNRLVLDSRLVDAGRLDNQYADRVAGVTEVGPGATRRIDAYFFLPPGVDPDEVTSFGVDWTLEARPDAPFYAERTPFLEEPYVYSYAYYAAPYPYAMPYAYYGI